MFKLDKDTRTAIAEAIQAAVLERERERDNRYLTSEQLCERFSMFTADWLKRYGWKLPRDRVVYLGDDGKKHVTRWGYSLNEIQDMIRDGRIHNL